MAIVTRRYKFSNPSAADLTRLVGHSAAFNASFPLTVIDIDVDNAAAGATDALDEYMASIGCVFDAAAVANVSDSQMNFPLEGPDGAVGAPTWAFSNESDMGIARIAGKLALITAGSIRMDMDVFGIVIRTTMQPSTAGVALGVNALRWFYLATQGAQFDFIDKTADFILTLGEFYVRFNGSNLTATLPSPPGLGRTYVLKNINATALTVAAGGSDTTDVTSIAQNGVKKLVYDEPNTNWIDMTDN